MIYFEHDVNKQKPILIYYNKNNDDRTRKLLKREFAPILTKKFLEDATYVPDEFLVLIDNENYWWYIVIRNEKKNYAKITS